ncbi:MAG TPA: hypothetical protein VH877_14970 [Polyangia bacterium]|jgi:hypothetical protein|nr:hypothetical protein [Polyangia bacterium]
MAPRTLDPARTSLDDLIYEVLYTLIRLRLLPVPKSLATLFEGLHTEAKSVRDQENQLNEQAIAAAVTLGWREESINISIRSLSTAILHLVHNIRTDPLHIRYFGDLTPSDLIRAPLDRKLATVRGWIESLRASPHEELRSLGALIEQQIAATDQATQDRQQAEQAIEDFQLLGARHQLFERVNTERKLAYGELAKAMNEDEELRLRSETSDLFFRQVHRRVPDDSVEAARKVVDKARKTLAEAENRLREAQERERAEAQAEAQKLADKAALDAIERDMTAASRTAAEIRKRLTRSKRA